MMESEDKKKLYLDVSTLCRPFDDQAVMRNRLETDAYYLIIQAVQDGAFGLVVSPVHYQEVDAIKDTQERQEVLSLLKKLGTAAECDLEQSRKRAEASTRRVLELLMRHMWPLPQSRQIASSLATTGFSRNADGSFQRSTPRTPWNSVPRRI